MTGTTNCATESTHCASEAARPLFTVFTPTRNRAHAIPRMYESLLAQTLRDFEWLVVDNASTDGTPELASQWRDLPGSAARALWLLGLPVGWLIDRRDDLRRRRAGQARYPDAQPQP